MANEGLLQYQPNVFQRGGLLPFGLDRARGLLSRNVSPDAGAATAPNWYGGLLPPFPKERMGMTDPLDPLIGVPKPGEGSGLTFPPEVLAQLDREQANVREMVRINSLTPGQPKHSVMEIAGAQPTMTRLLPGMVFGAGITPYVGRLAGALRKMPQEKMTAEQAEGYLRKTPVSKEEVEWTGVRGLLEEGRPVTRTGLLEQVKAQPLELRDVVKGKAGKPTVADDTILAEAGLRPDVGPGGEVGFFDDAHDLWMLDEIRANPRFSDAVVGAAERIETGRMGGGAKFSEWQLPGGKNYQETLITMPKREPTTADRITKAEELAQSLHGKPFQALPAIDRANITEVVRKQGPDIDFTGGHMDEPNTLAWARHNERTLTNGDKTLFIEEIQSDWHQKGRKSGYATATAAETKALQAESDAIINRGARNPTTGTLTLRPEDLPRYNELQPLIEQGLPIKPGTVPDAPFKKNWHDLTFRRMAHEAAKRDMDTISWTPGQVQADRYDLSKQVKRVYYLDDGTLRALGHNNDVVINETIPKDKVADYIGKAAADKLFKSRKAGIWSDEAGLIDGYDISGLDLKVGGDYHKKLYDKKWRKSADKLGKKYGVKAEIKKVSRVFNPLAPEGRRIGSMPETEVWSLKLTPELKKDLLKGGVTFGVAAAAMDQDNETLGLLKKPRK